MAEAGVVFNGEQTMNVYVHRFRKGWQLHRVISRDQYLLEERERAAGLRRSACSAEPARQDTRGRAREKAAAFN